jgi:hypothetical protein
MSHHRRRFTMYEEEQIAGIVVQGADGEDELADTLTDETVAVTMHGTITVGSG